MAGFGWCYDVFKNFFFIFLSSDKSNTIEYLYTPPFAFPEIKSGLKIQTMILLQYLYVVYNINDVEQKKIFLDIFRMPCNRLTSYTRNNNNNKRTRMVGIKCPQNLMKNSPNNF